MWNSYPRPNIPAGDDSFYVFATNGFSVHYSAQRDDGGGTRWVSMSQGFKLVGGADFFLLLPVTIDTWTGAYLSDAGIWVNASDQNRKTDFESVDPRDILEKLSELPVRKWRYTNEVAGVKHLGPTAQDFQAAFGLGMDDKAIGTIDADGVALAAIQGLNHKLVERDVEIRQLKQRLERLEQVLNEKAAGEP